MSVRVAWIIVTWLITRPIFIHDLGPSGLGRGDQAIFSLVGGAGRLQNAR